MTITIEPIWANPEQTTLYYELTSELTSNNLAYAERQLRQMMGAVKHPVSMVVHAPNIGLISMETLRALHKFLESTYPNRERLVMVMPSAALSSVCEMLRRSFGGNLPRHVSFSNSVDDAEQILQGH